MARDIYSRNVEYGGAFSSDGAKINFTYDLGGVTTTLDSGMLSQRITWQYGQQISRLQELESDKVYLVAGGTQGALTLDTILGPKRLMINFYHQYGDVCNTAGNSLTFDAQVGCGAPGHFGAGSPLAGERGTSAKIMISHAVIEQLQGAVQADNMLIQSSINMQFLRLNMEEAGGVGTRAQMGFATAPALPGIPIT